ncbi:MAG: hypothetical protein KTR32_04385 [Granulosicoccus sp.]|nr:hypothetical protein [Granulosicoccus sp.]
MKALRITLAGLVMSLTSFYAQADNEDRDGLLLGIALGSSSINTSVDLVSDPNDTASSSDSRGTAVSLRFGGGLGNKSAMYLLTQTAATENELGHSLTGLGASYYFNKNGASLYLMGGFGYGLVSYAESEKPEGTGTAAMAGIGLELGMGLSVELNHMRVRTEPENDSINPSGIYNIASTQFLVGFTWF